MHAQGEPNTKNLRRTFVLPPSTRRIFDHDDGKSEQQGATLKLLATMARWIPPCQHERQRDWLPSTFTHRSEKINDFKSFLFSTADLGYSHRLHALYAEFPLPQLQAFSSLGGVPTVSSKFHVERPCGLFFHWKRLLRSPRVPCLCYLTPEAPKLPFALCAYRRRHCCRLYQNRRRYPS